MKVLFLSTLLINVFLTANAQLIVSGKISNFQQNPLIGANVYLKNSYDGASTDTTGYFSFRTDLSGEQILVVSSVGYKSMETPIYVSEKLNPVSITLQEELEELLPVVITAGSFEASDKRRSATLKLLDISTTPSAVGDIYGALTTFPGTQVVGSEGGLYVRGGEGYEAKTFMDGMAVTKPYFSKMPDIPTRGRFTPILFSGSVFSTGGYSAEYGQALSSTLILNTTGIADETQSSIMLMTVGISGSHTQRWQKSSLAMTGMYNNMAPYFSLHKQAIDWEKYPSSTDVNIIYRKKSGRNGMFKLFGSYNAGGSAMHYTPQSDENSILINLNNHNYYVNSTYTNELSDKWVVKSGLAFTKDDQTIKMDTFSVRNQIHAVHQKTVLIYDHNENFALKIGEESSVTLSGLKYRQFTYDFEYNTDFTIHNPAIFVEPELRVNSHFAIRPGVRAEYTGLIKEATLVPRISFAYKTGSYSQISAAYGRFHQRPEDNYLLNEKKLESEQATHYILNYQYEKNSKILRMEFYRKNYHNLIKIHTEQEASYYSNSGSGKATGVDVFWRDSKSVRNLDYWMSYSFIDTKRNYKNFEGPITPSFISPHTFSAVGKYMIMSLKTHVGINYTHASGKMSYHPQFPNLMGDKIKSFNDLSLNLVYLTHIFHNQAVIYFNINNVPGFNNVYGYNYATEPNENGGYDKYPIQPQAKRFVVVGVFVTFK